MQVETTCSCCDNYVSWRKAHPSDAQALQKIADVPYYYKVCNEKVTIHEIGYQGTIRALQMAPMGECTGIASSFGPHPFTCNACEALQHGKNSQLLHKLNRDSKLKHPHSDCNRAGKSGVSRKHCSKEEISLTLQKRKADNVLQNKKSSISI